MPGLVESLVRYCFFRVVDFFPPEPDFFSTHVSSTILQASVMIRRINPNTFGFMAITNSYVNGAVVRFFLWNIGWLLVWKN